ncbi:MAG: tryptophan synthase subunit alpha [Candidatus Omnitrophica bacterium]|nr:tryptophan synthase subunit alpha [Candidatus Omnitrophota bacterium]
MNRIDQKFKELRHKRKKAFIAYLTAGDPDLMTTKELVHALEGQGVDIIELGVPFSDPLADGLTIQAASQRALKNNVTPRKILNLVKQIRETSCIPIALMTYYNPVFHFDEIRFVQMAAQSGVDGLIIPDLPPEEAIDLIRASKKHHMSNIFFLAPTSSLSRMKTIIDASSGFVYFVSVAGVTGERRTVAADVLKKVKQAKSLTTKPVCLGFGLSQPQQIKKAAQVADGVIVGSAIVNQIIKNANQEDLVSKVSRFVRTLTCELD